MYRHLFLAAALCISAPAFAQKTDLIQMEKMTSYEIRDAIAAGKTTVIVPSGGTGAKESSVISEAKTVNA